MKSGGILVSSMPGIKKDKTPSKVMEGSPTDTTTTKAEG
jgi:hypothetical protein